MSVKLSTAPALSASNDLLLRWRKIPVAVTVDLSSDIRQLDNAIRALKPAGTQPSLFGRAITALCEPPDFGPVMYSLDTLVAGDVLVIAAHGFEHNAMIGDVLCGLLRNKGVTGVVVDGAIRDVAQIVAWDDFPVYARVINPRGPTGYSKGYLNVAVKLGACDVYPGDLIMGDDDGLVALSDEDLVAWIDIAEARLDTEANWTDRLMGGESAVSVFGLNDSERGS